FLAAHPHSSRLPFPRLCVSTAYKRVVWPKGCTAVAKEGVGLKLKLNLDPLFFNLPSQRKAEAGGFNHLKSTGIKGAKQAIPSV
ncbi:MAG: hypothetical protein VKN33_09795, partial [Candidatus Sericytochromatia bacterium]|nr:hypothetical protein [Candidatus Sericytochromatia bacterium]